MASFRFSKIRKNKTVLFSVAVVPIVVIAAYSQLFGDVSNRTVTVTGTLQAKEIPIASKVGGRILRLYAQEGDFIKAGDALVEFELPELEAKRQQLLANIQHSESQLIELKNGPRKAEIEKAAAAAAEAKQHWLMLKSGFRKEDVDKAFQQRQEAESALLMLQHGYRKEDVALAQAQMEQARAQADFAHQDYLRYSKLSQSGAIALRDAQEAEMRWKSAEKAYEALHQSHVRSQAGPRSEEIDGAKARLSAAKAQETMMHNGSRHEEVEMARQQYLQSQATLDLLKQGTRYEQIEKAAADLAMSKAQLSEVEAQLAERKLRAPVDAEVSVMDLHSGEVFGPNRAIATLTRLDDIWTRVYIPERQLSRVHVGQAVNIKADAYPGQTFKGKVVQIPGVAEFTPKNVQTPEERSAQVFGIKVTVENKEHLLRGGMNAEVELPPLRTPWERLARLIR